jgi:hypothetical protein
MSDPLRRPAKVKCAVLDCVTHGRLLPVKRRQERPERHGKSRRGEIVASGIDHHQIRAGRHDPEQLEAASIGPDPVPCQRDSAAGVFSLPLRRPTAPRAILGPRVAQDGAIVSRAKMVQLQTGQFIGTQPDAAVVGVHLKWRTPFGRGDNHGWSPQQMMELSNVI